MRIPSGFHLGARVRIVGHPDLTGQVTQVGGSYLWVRVDGQPGAAWMLPRAALEHAPAPGDVVTIRNEESKGKPSLGLATTRQLLNEIRARIDVDYSSGGGGLDYTTVGGRPDVRIPAQDGGVPAEGTDQWTDLADEVRRVMHGPNPTPANILRAIRDHLTHNRATDA